MNAQVTVDERNGYKDILKLLSPLPPFNTLRDREMDVLSELIYWYNYYSELPANVRQTMVFDYNTRVQIMTKLDITVEVLNNNISWLRKRGFVSGRELKFVLPKLVSGSNSNLTFNFKVIPYGEVEENMVNNNQ